MLYQISDVTVSLGGNTIFSHISMDIKEHDKIALVGGNGTGKTTLLKLIMGEISPDLDDKRQGSGIRTTRSVTKGMLRQIAEEDDGKTVEAYLLELADQFEEFSRERYDYEVEFNRIFTAFGFLMEDKKRTLSSFSGGEKTKIFFIRLLLEKPDILLLDEPTNHLDLEAVEWLENYMKSYPKAVVFVSHDRFFLDRVAGSVYELEDGQLTHYAGNYTEYRRQKRANYEINKKRYLESQEERKRLEDLVRKFKNKASKASFAKAKLSQLNRMPVVTAPKEVFGHVFQAPIEPEYPGPKLVYEAEELKIGYSKKVLAEITLRLRRGQKIAIIGANGAGKSTFLKVVIGEQKPIKGKSQMGNNVLFGYFDQSSAELMIDDTIYDYFKKAFPNLVEKELRNTLASFLFTKDMVYRKISDLSGGERARVYLAMLLMNRPNLMVLDEPTNHMDIPSKETLESAFCAYKGSMLLVSHDRYLLSKVADAILLFENGEVFYYPFGYKHYLEHAKDVDTKDISALVTAKDQAMVDSLRAVPKPERHRLREQNTELAYVDWKRGLAKQPLDRARQALDMALIDGEDAQIDICESEYTNACLSWYDIYMETE